MLSGGLDMAMTHKNSWEMWLSAQDKASQNPAGIGKGPLKTHPQLSSYWTLLTEEGVAVGALPGFPWMTPHLYMEG